MTLKRVKEGPERKIQDAIKKFLREREWVVMETHGNMYQSGFPDLYAAHFTKGSRWIEVKNPLSYSFTPAQMRSFPQLASVGVGIWIMTAADEHEYKKLFLPPNWGSFLGKSSYKRSDFS